MATTITGISFAYSSYTQVTLSGTVVTSGTLSSMTVGITGSITDTITPDAMTGVFSKTYTVTTPPTIEMVATDGGSNTSQTYIESATPTVPTISGQKNFNGVWNGAVTLPLAPVSPRDAYDPRWTVTAWGKSTNGFKNQTLQLRDAVTTLSINTKEFDGITVTGGSGEYVILRF